MEEETYLKILSNLNMYKYKGAISYSRYNEPMAFPELFKKRVIQAREYLYNNKLVSNTNGDYLTKENLEGLLLSELTVMDYDCIGTEACISKMESAGITVNNIEGNYIYGNRNGIKVLYFVDWPKHSIVQDRGGILKQYSNTIRVTPCYEPQHFLGIDYNGYVTPCCNIRSDNEKQVTFILGNVNETYLSNIFNSNKAEIIRSITIENPSSVSMCKFCTKEPGRYTRENPGIDY